MWKILQYIPRSFLQTQNSSCQPQEHGLLKALSWGSLRNCPLTKGCCFITDLTLSGGKFASKDVSMWSTNDPRFLLEQSLVPSSSSAPREAFPWNGLDSVINATSFNFLPNQTHFLPILQGAPCMTAPQSTVCVQISQRTFPKEPGLTHSRRKEKPPMWRDYPTQTWHYVYWKKWTS